jgi:ribonuclease BN (tRNA processing enzyme)
MSMDLIALGTGGALSAERYSTSLALQVDGHTLLIDCPHPMRKMMREAEGQLDVGDVDALVLTHLHADHASGLEGFAFFSYFVLQRPVRLIAHPETARGLWEDHLAITMSRLIGPDGTPKPPMVFEDYFHLVPLIPGEAVVEGPFVIEGRGTVHHIPTLALRIAAGGRMLGYSADTAFDPSLIQWLAEGDLVVHETNYGGAHTPYEALVGLPLAIREKLRLVAYPDAFDVKGSVIPVLPEGRRVAI